MNKRQKYSLIGFIGGMLCLIGILSIRSIVQKQYLYVIPAVVFILTGFGALWYSWKGK